MIAAKMQELENLKEARQKRNNHHAESHFVEGMSLKQTKTGSAVAHAPIEACKSARVMPVGLGSARFEGAPQRYTGVSSLGPARVSGMPAGVLPSQVYRVAGAAWTYQQRQQFHGA